METIDYKKKYKHLYSPSSKVVSEVTVPTLQFLTLNGNGDPEGEEFQQAVGALYSVAYTLKFWAKKHPAPDGSFEYSVAPLEGLWWAEGYEGRMSSNAPRDKWRWTLMIMQPEFITKDLVKGAIDEVIKKKPNPRLKDVELSTFDEGMAVQIMHIGPYSEEITNIQKLDDYMEVNGYTSNGKHHEIYLGDPRRTAPERLRTVLRHPIKK